MYRLYYGNGKRPDKVGEVLIVNSQDGHFWLTVLAGTFPMFSTRQNVGCDIPR